MGIRLTLNHNILLFVTFSMFTPVKAWLVVWLVKALTGIRWLLSNFRIRGGKRQ